MDGPSPSPETSTPNGVHVVWEEPDGSKWYLIDIGGELSFHSDIKGEITAERLNRFRELLDCLVISLMQRGWDHLDTWVFSEDEQNKRFSKMFGFYPTGFDKIVQQPDGVQMRFSVLRLNFPTE